MGRRAQDGSERPGPGRLAAGLLLGLVLAAGFSSAGDRRSDADPAADYAAIHTYAWMTRPVDVPDVERRAPLLDRLLHETVSEELRAKKVNPAPEGQADLLFIYYLDPRDNLDDYTRYYLPDDMPAWLRPLKVYKEEMSVVVIDAISREEGRLVWRGVFAMKLAEPWTLAKKIRRVTAGLIRDIPIPKR
jgi:hypothetical protein